MKRQSYVTSVIRYLTYLESGRIGTRNPALGYQDSSMRKSHFVHVMTRFQIASLRV